MRYNKQELVTLSAQPSNKFDKEGLLYITERQEGFFRRTEGRNLSSLFGTPRSSTISLVARRSNSFSTNNASRQSSANAQSTRPEDVITRDATPDTEEENRMRIVNKRTARRRKSLSCIGGTGKVSTERWCRLRGNLLFYFKSDDQFSDVQGVIVLEKCRPIEDSQGEDTYGFIIEFEDGLRQRIGTNSQAERNDWIQAITRASYEEMKMRLQLLQERLDRKKGAVLDIDIDMLRLQTGANVNIQEVPLCETALACDNLLCDGYGRPPNPSIVVHVTVPHRSGWLKYGRTEVVEKSSNPQFVRTVLFRSGDGLSASDSQVRFTVYDVREKMSQTAVPLGSAEIALNAIKDTTRLRIPLRSSSNNNSGFITISSWSPVQEKKMNPRSPAKSSGHFVLGHRRSQSLPPKLGVKLFVPPQHQLSLLFANPSIYTYRFQSGLGGDISVHELMLESQLCFLIPQQMLSIWILREKELLQEISGMGELGGEWRHKQMDLLDRHLKLLKNYSQAKQNLQQYNRASNKTFFKQSNRKADEALEFAPVNLHLQRMCAHNDTLKRSGVYDVITVGAFTRHTGKAKTGGLIKLLQQLKSTAASTGETYKVQTANDAVQAIKQLRREIVEIMSQLLVLAKTKNPKGMLPLCTEMVTKTRSLLNIWEPSLVDEAFEFIERHRIVEDSTQPRMDMVSLSPFKKITQQLGALDLKSPELEDFATPLGPAPDLWPKGRSPGSSLNFKAKSPSTTDLKAILTVQNSVRDFHEKQLKAGSPAALKRAKEEVEVEAEKTTQSLPVHIDLKFSETHFDVDGQVSSTEHRPTDVLEVTEDYPESDSEAYLGGVNTTGFLDQRMMSSSASANYYRPTEEPEPLDLTQLNIEASVMCLVSKVKFLCGRCGSPAVRLRQPNTNVRGFTAPDVVTNQPATSTSAPSNGGGAEGEVKKPMELNLVALNQAVGEVTRQVVTKGNKFTDGLDLSMTTDWTSELRPSMRKLRQAMDGLLKTARLMHSVQRLHQDSKKMTATLSVMYRRDICFSQALTALVSGLMARLWGTRIDTNFINLLYNLGPLAYFEGLLSLYGSETDMWGDMCVAIEDLSAVTFKLHRTNIQRDSAALPVPKIVGSRQSLTVILPVPESVQELLPTKEEIVFKVTPVFFNIGINEKATISETLRYTTEQNRSNMDNFDRLRQYHLKYKKLVFVQPDTPVKNSSGGMMATQPNAEAVTGMLLAMEQQLKANVSKNVKVLQIAEDICGALTGIEFISCKSAKDRTAMGVTLQQCRILQTEFHLPATNMQTALNTMRSEGTRSDNTMKNIGLKKYAFNLPQVLSLPQQYRPPAGSYGKAQS